jgi:hypothetical protein
MYEEYQMVVFKRPDGTEVEVWIATYLPTDGEPIEVTIEKDEKKNDEKENANV